MKLRISSDWREWKARLASHVSLGGMIFYSLGIALGAAGGAAPWFHRIPLWAFSLIALLITSLTFVGQFIILERRKRRGSK